MESFLNQIADVGTRITWTDKRFRRFLHDIRDLMDFKGEINNNWGMYSLYIHSNGRSIKDFFERLSQYSIIVDSIDRNFTVFPNPFQFNIIFNGDKFNNSPVIQKKFKDIKYIKLDNLTLPNEYDPIIKESQTKDSTYDDLFDYFELNKEFLVNNDYINTKNIRITSTYISDNSWCFNFNLATSETDTDINNVYEIDSNGNYFKYYLGTSSRKISDDRMFYVYIPEIKSQNYTTSNKNVTFFCQCTGTNDYTLLTNVYPTFMFYKDSKLELANKYTVKITDRSGKVYKTNNLDYNSNQNNCSCDPDIIDYSCRCTYIRHPLNPRYQVMLQFKIGTFEDDIYKELLTNNPI